MPSSLPLRANFGCSYRGIKVERKLKNELVTVYGDCMKNHAAHMGLNVVDGCGEFMPGGEEGTPEALNCAACECHRNFHRLCRYVVQYYEY
ncbi:hypothetical protein MKW94_021911 [Papaver nudicaule]|uniref:ZF-HD dimerization-type domain-containing protein n=1 Tax=Papaver nudicaule TaxID=74823 RepID=A0AA41SPN8_PAPNU|nr:hypothetical protein [Papaver nudicaule]